MKNFIINLLGGVTKEEYERTKDIVDDLKREFDSFCSSYSLSWLKYKSSIDFERHKKRLFKMVINQKPNIKNYWGSTSEVYFFYGTETYLKYEKSLGDKQGRYSGFLDGFGEIPYSLAEEMFTIADKINKHRGEEEK